MPTWGEILTELKEGAKTRGGSIDFDGVRRKYLQQLHQLTGRSVILYASDWLRGRGSGAATSIVLEDMQGMMEACNALPGDNLDLILHSPGGSAEATASIVKYLRRKYTHIRAFVPLAAMSAATMWALSADEIYMGKHSQLGPIDPQMVTPQGQIPARAVIEQFERAKDECKKDPSVLGAWIPMLQQYGPALLVQCEQAEELARRMVEQWLAEYMFVGEKHGKKKAAKIAKYFANYKVHKSHSLGLDRDEARAQGVNIKNLEDDQALQDAVLSVHHVAMHTFQGPAIKIIENHLGKAFVQQGRLVEAPTPPAAAPPGSAIN